ISAHERRYPGPIEKGTAIQVSRGSPAGMPAIGPFQKREQGTAHLPLVRIGQRTGLCGCRQVGGGGTVFPDQSQQLPLYQKKCAQDLGNPKEVHPLFGKQGDRGGAPVALLRSIEVLQALHKGTPYPDQPLPSTTGLDRKEDRSASRGPTIRLWDGLGKAK